MGNSDKPAVRKSRGVKAAPAPANEARGNRVDWVFAQAKSERGHKRREAILKAATAEFMQKGYQGASLRNIIATSGGSAETLYRQFGNKEGLFRAVVSSPRERHLPSLGAASGRPVEEELFAIARAFLDSALEPESLAIVRMMVGESGAMPEISRMIWESGPAGFQARLAEYFERQNAAGVLDIPDPQLAARQFVGVTRANLDVRVMCGVAVATPEELDRQARLGVDLFLGGVLAKPKS